MLTAKKYPLFSVYGIELEYMVVDQVTLNVLPIVDKLFYEMLGHYANEVPNGEIEWNNELVAHVVELKTGKPVSTLAGLEHKFYKDVQQINQLLAKHNAMLMPTGAHPWMNPQQEMHLWPHGDKDIYESYHRIFNCQGHGWANLQSTHINLPFANNEEFVALHNAIRLLLPIIPALTASTPILDNKISGYVDTRLMYYGNNQKLIPQIAGDVIPEWVDSIDAYHQIILNPIYAAIAPHDAQNVLQEEWLNSRGAIARFDRNAIEIRIVDLQESPKVDLACVAGIVSVLKYLTQQLGGNAGKNLSTKQLKLIFDRVIKEGFSAMIDDKAYLQIFNINGPISAKMLWQHLLEVASDDLTIQDQKILLDRLSQGNLSERILRAVNDNLSENLAKVYRQLSECLANNQIFQVA